VEVNVGCSTPDRARSVLAATAFGEKIEVEGSGLSIHLPSGTGKDAIAEINRLLVEDGIAVFHLEEQQVSLESWFLQVTSRLGENL
jgi:hypothetical protein